MSKTNPVWAEILDQSPSDPSRLVRYMRRELDSINANPAGLWRDMDPAYVDGARVLLERWLAEHA